MRSGGGGCNGLTRVEEEVENEEIMGRALTPSSPPHSPASVGVL